MPRLLVACRITIGDTLDPSWNPEGLGNPRLVSGYDGARQKCLPYMACGFNRFPFIGCEVWSCCFESVAFIAIDSSLQLKKKGGQEQHTSKNPFHLLKAGKFVERIFS